MCVFSSFLPRETLSPSSLQIFEVSFRALPIVASGWYARHPSSERGKELLGLGARRSVFGCPVFITEVMSFVEALL